MNSPLLSAYYGGASVIESYYKGQMYDDIETKLGKDIFDVIEEYNDLKTFGERGESTRFYNQNKAKIKQYYKMKDDWNVIINQNVAQMTNYIPDAEGAGIREDINPNAVGSQQLAGSLQPQQQPSLQEFQSYITPSLMNMVVDYFYQGDQLTDSGRRQLERLAREMGYYDVDALLQAVGSSLYAQGQ